MAGRPLTGQGKARAGAGSSRPVTSCTLVRQQEEKGTALSSGPLEAASGEVARRPSHSDLGVTSSVGPFATRGVFTECRRLGQRNMVFVPFPVEALAFRGGPGGSRAPPELLGGACAGTEKQN